MKHIPPFIRSALLLIVFLQSTASTQAQRTVKPLSTKTVVFTNVNVLSMENDKILLDLTVVISNGRIAAVGPTAQIKVPANAFQISGKNKYLLPGLSDMHVHLPYNQDDVKDTPALLHLFVVNGVTTVLNLLGLPSHLELRDRIDKGTEFGPVIFTSGFYINEPFVRTADEVEAKVIEQKRAGYDVIKMHGNLSREAYHRLFEVARREKIKVIGHAPRNLGYQPMLEERQDAVAHAEEYVTAYFGFNRRCCTAEEIGPMVRYISTETAKAGTWVIPTLTIFKGIAPQIKDLPAVLNQPTMRYVPSSIAADWQPDRNRYKQNKKEEIQTFEGVYGLQAYLVKGFRDAGVRLLAGTDTPVTAAVVPGFSIHQELENLVEAGLTPYEALRAATSNAAKFLEQSSEFGTITVGKRADLLLIDQNPLNDIRATTQISGVMIRGRWLPKAELDSMLAKLSTLKK